MFIQRKLINILVFRRRIRHRKLRNKGNLTREFDIGDIVVVINKSKSIRKYGVTQKLVFKIKVSYRFLEKSTAGFIGYSALIFVRV